MNYAESRGDGRDAMYTYTLSPLVPGAIWASVCKLN